LSRRTRISKNSSTKRRKEAARANQIAQRTVAELRRQLLPLFQALRAVFGEIDTIAPPESDQSGAAPQSDKKRAVWESWKQKLGGKPAELIDALLDHREMSAVQLRVALKCHIQTVYDTTAKLQKLGLVNKKGGKYSLKEL
jgi:hypothetical protein